MLILKLIILTPVSYTKEKINEEDITHFLTVQLTSIHKINTSIKHKIIQSLWQ